MFYGLVTTLQAAEFKLKVPDFTNINSRIFKALGKIFAQKFFKKFAVIYIEEGYRYLSETKQQNQARKNLVNDYFGGLDNIFFGEIERR